MFKLSSINVTVDLINEFIFKWLHCISVINLAQWPMDGRVENVNNVIFLSLNAS